jgi:hypothetical protein
MGTTAVPSLESSFEFWIVGEPMDHLVRSPISEEEETS